MSSARSRTPSAFALLSWLGSFIFFTHILKNGPHMTSNPSSRTTFQFTEFFEDVDVLVSGLPTCIDADILEGFLYEVREL